MKRTVFFMILLFLLNALCLSAQAKPVGKFSKVEGRVDITRLGAPAILVHKGDEVGVGDIIRVKSKSKAEIIFGDGGILRIAQKSRVKIDEYIMEEERKKGIFNLFRGKIENVLKKTGGFFGFKKKNKHEVHTPTAVCGVRGTDFFSTYQKGISNFVFKEGQGYGYSKNRPDQVMNINTGQAMMVIKPDLPPVIRMATDSEIAAHSADMDIKKEEDKDEEKKRDEKIDESPDDKKRGDKARDKKSRDDEPEGREPGDDEKGDDKRGDSEKDDRSRSRYARAGDKSGDDDRLDDDEPGDDRRGDHRRGDRGPGDDRRGDYGPRDHDSGPGDYRAGDYGPDGPPRGDYGPGGPPPPGGDYGPYGPPPPGEYWGPPPPGEYFGEPGDFYASDFGPDDYWGEPGDDYWGEPGDDYWGEPGDDYWGEPGDDYWGEPFDDYWEGPDFFDPDTVIDGDDPYTIPPFSVDSIGISGNSGNSYFSLSMSGKYNAPPPFIYMYEGIRGALTGDLKSGYFFGFTACGWDPFAQTVDGTAAFFYIAGDKSGGIFKGAISGNYYPGDYTWNASGSLDWVELNEVDLTVPDSVTEIYDYPRDIFIVENSGSGNFYDAGSDIVGAFQIYKSDGIFDSIQEEQHWGFWQNHIGANYTTLAGKTLVDDCKDWFLEWEQEGWEIGPGGIDNLRLYMSAKGTIPHYRNIEGDVAGGWVDIEYAVTGIAVGELHGGYDPCDLEIFAGSGGVWISTSILMDKLTTDPGRNDLAKLNIPNVTIGKATLEGSYVDGGNDIDVTMTDVTFLANASGGIPRIWATNNVSGTYTGTPVAGWTVPLGFTGSSDSKATAATANFNLQTWVSGKWDATVTNGVGTVNSKSISFKGGAAGSIDSGTEFSGTAAGWAKEN